MKPVVVIPIGLPGAGKTALTAVLVHELDGHVLSRDAIRAAMFDELAYTDEEKQAAFEGMLSALKANLELGRTTLIDGIAFSSEHDFEQVMRAVTQAGGVAVPIYCVCPVDVAKQRVAADREAGAHMAADRTPELVERVAARFWDVPETVPRIDMTKPRDMIVADTLQCVHARWAAHVMRSYKEDEETFVAQDVQTGQDDAGEDAAGGRVAASQQTTGQVAAGQAAAIEQADISKWARAKLRGPSDTAAADPAQAGESS